MRKIKTTKFGGSPCIARNPFSHILAVKSYNFKIVLLQKKGGVLLRTEKKKKSVLVQNSGTLDESTFFVKLSKNDSYRY